MPWRVEQFLKSVTQIPLGRFGKPKLTPSKSKSALVIGAIVINDIPDNLYLLIARILLQTLFESLGWRGVDGEKVGGVRSGIYLGEIRSIAVDARPQLVVQDAAYDAFIALEHQQAAGVVVRVDSRSTMVEQGLDEGVGLVVGALGCGKIGENIPCSHEIDAGNETQGQGAEPETTAYVALARFDAFPEAPEALAERPEDCRGHE